MSQIPGITAKHAIITPTCRENLGQARAFDEAVRQLKIEYLAGQGGANVEANFHVALVVERSDWLGARTSEQAAENSVWHEVLEAVQQAWETPQFYADSPIELIQRLIDERDEALRRLDTVMRLVGLTKKSERSQR